jgi:spectinomycin phosphotransferase
VTRAVEPIVDPALTLVKCLQFNYGLILASQTLVEGGLDANAHGFKVATPEGKEYFLKLRNRGVNQPALNVPRALADCGVQGLVPPIPTLSGALWGECRSAVVVLYPLIEGVQAGGNGLTESQWMELGSILGQVHSCPLEPELVATVRHDFLELPSARSLRRTIRYLETGPPLWNGAARYAALLLLHRQLLEEMLDHTEAMRARLVTRSIQTVVCHADVHPWNIMVEASGGLKLIDWDDGPLIAPKERDFIFVPDKYLQAFLKGYGPLKLDMELLEYFRAERQIEDMASTATLVFDSTCADDSLIEEYVAGQERFFAGVTGNPPEGASWGDAPTN